MTSDADFETRALALLEEAIGKDEAERRAFVKEAAGDDEALKARVLRLLGSHERSGNRLATGAPDLEQDEPDPPERIGAYRVGELLGQGGMGAVYKGERDAGDFDHAVAIKLIRPGVLSPALVERFERERQILASLSHPHIARLYDGGTTEEGQPFFVMEFIEGVPITRWAEEQALPREARLELMIAVCRAVGVAHQNLIIHRDLTPSNVLVTPDGTPKLIDFGIARPQEDATAEAASGGEAAAARMSLTPGYAAPERYSGAPATTLTDIYSLGKLLARLLKGVEVDADLSEIVAKASSDDPAERYPSAGAMARDIERYLGTYPVEARNGGRGYVLRKFISRQKFAVAAVAVIVLLLVGGLTATAIGFQRARIAQAEAETRFEEVRELANTLLFDIYDAVDRVPGSTAARELLASTAQSYLDALATDPDAPFDVRLEAGRGYMRLADVMGGVGGGNLGLREEADANYRRADEILTGLHQERPGHRDVALALADLRYVRSNYVVQTTDDMEQGLELARSIAPILERGCASGDDCTLRRAQALVAEGQNLYWLEDFDTAIAAFERAVALIDHMEGDARRAGRAIRLAALAHRFRGDAIYYQDDISGSVAAYDIAVELLTGAIEGGIDNPDIRRDLALVEWTRGGSLDEAGRVEEAVAALDRSHAIIERLVEADPEDAGTLRLLAVVSGQRGLTLSSAERYAEAIAAAEESLAIRRRLSRMQPEESGFFRDVAIQLNGLGDIHQRAGNRSAACDYYRQTVAQFDRLETRWGLSEFDRNDTYTRAREGLAVC